MPTFDFHCQKCQTVFEFARAFGSKKMPVCPKCGSKKTEKLLSPPSIQFKGTGFYKTDSGKKAPHKPEKKVKSETSESAKSDAPKSAETKPTTSEVSKTE